MRRIATLAGPGTLRSPDSQNCTVRTVHSSASASCCVVMPRRSRAARTSAGDTAAPRRVGGNDRAVQQDAVGMVAVGIGADLRCGLLAGRGDGALAAKLPASAPVHLDPHGVGVFHANNVRHPGCVVKNNVRAGGMWLDGIAGCAHHECGAGGWNHGAAELVQLADQGRVAIGANTFLIADSAPGRNTGDAPCSWAAFQPSGIPP